MKLTFRGPDQMAPSDTTVDSAEVAKFEAMADAWWDPHGPFAPLHGMTPCRLDYIVTQICAEFGRDRKGPSPLSGLRIVDVGCGGGLLSEPLARLGAEVTGIDAAPDSLDAARAHADRNGLSIDYRHTTAEALASEAEPFDVVLALEIVEHVADPEAFIRACAALVRPGGLFCASTLNKTAKSFALAVVGAEYILRWLPRGTHDWSRFLDPDRLAGMMTAAGLDPVDRKGMVYDPLGDRWSLSDRDLSVNYVMAAVKV